MHNPIIHKEIGINIISPTTSVCDHSSFPKEEIRDRIDLLITPIKILSALIQLISKIKKKQTFFFELIHINDFDMHCGLS